MEKFNNLCKSREIENIRVLLVSKTKPQYGVGIKYRMNGNTVLRSILPLVSVERELTTTSPVRVLDRIADIHPFMYSLLAQAYEYTERWSDESVSDIEDFIGISTIGDLHVYRNQAARPDRTVQS